MKRFESLISQYMPIISEAVDDPPGQQQGDKSVSDAKLAPAVNAADPVPPTAADQAARDTQDSLEESEKTLINILIDITTVLRDYLVAEQRGKPGNTEKVNKLNELIQTTRKNLTASTTAIQILSDFTNAFGSIFGEHFNSTTKR